jgi:N6-adenosine-specific RNA methylase IME4
MILRQPPSNWTQWQKSHHGQQFRTILSDHPWPSSSTPGKARDHWMKTNMKPRYQTMTSRQLLEFPLPALAHDDCVLVMWATWMHLALAMECIDAYGFRYCAGFPWLKVCKPHPAFSSKWDEPTIKPIYGPGVWAQGCTELILIARRGRPFGSQGNPRPARKGIIIAPRQEHSRKPAELQDWIDAKFPGPKIELFARQTRPGWTSWGDQLEIA